MKKNKKIVNLRAIAIILVVLGHSIIIYSPYWTLFATNLESPFFAFIKDIINIIQMPLFLSISGFLFYYTYSKTHFLKLLSNKFVRLIIPYFVISLLWLIPIRLMINYSNYNGQSILSIIYKNIILGLDNGHLWYLQTLFFCFIIIYIIQRIGNRLKIPFHIWESLILIILSAFHLTTIINIPIINNIQHYLIWFYLGFLLNQYNISKFNLSIKHLFLLIIIAILLILIIKIELLKFIITIILLVLVYILIPNKTTYILSNISANSFGIYLFHSPLIYITFRYLPNINPILMFVINFICLGIVVYFLTVFLRKIKLGIIIGEKIRKDR